MEQLPHDEELSVSIHRTSSSSKQDDTVNPLQLKSNKKSAHILKSKISNDTLMDSPVFRNKFVNGFKNTLPCWDDCGAEVEEAACLLQIL